MAETLWISIGILLALNLLFFAARASLAHARAHVLISMRERNMDGVDYLLKLLEKPRLRISLRIAVVFTHFLLAGCAGLLAAQLLPGLPAIALLSILFLCALVILALEFALQGAVLRNPEEWAIQLAWLGAFLDFLFTPISALMHVLLRVRSSDDFSQSGMSEDDLKTWAESEEDPGGLEQGERKMIYSIFQFGDTIVREIMVPRVDIQGLEAERSVEDAVRLMIATGHSRLPVYDDSIDNITGLLYAKDLLKVKMDCGAGDSIRAYLRPVYFVPEAKKVDELLKEMQNRRVHMAIVVDEYGGTAGLVTFEDILEEIVGEIRDEYDQGEELPYQELGEDEYLFRGVISLDRVNEILGTHIMTDQADTLAGYIYEIIGRVPQEGEQISVDGWNLIVEKVARRTIRKVRSVRATQTELEEEAQP